MTSTSIRDMKMVAQQSANWSQPGSLREDGVDRQADPDIKGVISATTRWRWAHGRRSRSEAVLDVIVVGFDGSNDVRDLIKKGGHQGDGPAARLPPGAARGRAGRQVPQVRLDRAGGEAADGLRADQRRQRRQARDLRR